jgi:hypothetical protein
MFNITETFKNDSPNFNELVSKYIKSVINNV